MQSFHDSCPETGWSTLLQDRRAYRPKNATRPLDAIAEASGGSVL